MKSPFVFPFMLLCLMAASVTSCSDHHSGFSRFANIDERGWVYGDSVFIVTSGLDSTLTRDLEIAVRHNNDYAYRNIWLEISYRNGHHTIIDSVELMLADEYGRWFGKGFGPSYQMSKRLSHHFPIADSTKIAVRHIMRVDTLEGIEQVGLTVSTVK